MIPVLKRGVATVDTKSISAVTLGKASFFVVPMWISNQGSGVFTTLDCLNMISSEAVLCSADQLLLGDRVQIQTLDVTQPPEDTTNSKLTGKGFIGFTQHSAEQLFAEAIHLKRC